MKHKTVRNTNQIFIPLVLCYIWFSSYGTSGQILGPSSQPEAYFNGSNYIRLHRTISLKNHTGLSFRTCAGGELFSQTYNENLIEVSVNAAGIKFIGKTAGKQYEEELSGSFLDNKWHTVHLMYILGNLTLNVDRKSQLIANGSYRVDLLRSPALDNEGAVLIVGKHYNGCIMEGPSIVFNESVIQPHDVKFGTCPIADDSCVIREDVKGSNFCLTEPCMRHGTCINGETTYSCICSPRYSGKNCEVDTGSPCKKTPSVCKNSGQCIEDNIGNYHCSCMPMFTGPHCEAEIDTHPLCTPNPCFSGGSCQVVPGTNKVECYCPPGFMGPNCEVNVDDCKMNPCRNSGKCIDGANNFTCDCSNTGYTGSVCEVNINECLQSPCMYQGICFDTYGSFICQCMAGYSGQICQYKVYECASQPCLNHGECEDQPGGYICHCAPGYTGPQCEMALHQAKCDSCGPYATCIDDSGTSCACKPDFPGIYPNCNAQGCFNNPCKNGGTCTSNLDMVNCTCPPGYTGSACDRVDLCVTHACRNGATCVEDLYSYNCICPDGFKGVYCDQRVKCADEPCDHDVECIDFLEGYYCTCEPGWTGYNCDVNLDKCLSEPCLNGGTCFDQVPSFACQCVPGFTGELCQIKIDECASLPCSNGGTCENKVNGYLCKCTDQWMGVNCERPFDICEREPCLNSGVCKATLSRRDYVCDCVKGFEGKNCDINIDDCLRYPCPPGKVCVDLVDGYDCRCPPGYAGIDCSIDIDPCAKNPCPLNSQCLLKPGSYNYTCECHPGYTGLGCLDIDECNITDICNQGICVNNPGSYQCYCKPGYTGERCNLDFDECLSSPCHNDATCLNKVNNFDCICPPGYTGKTCAINIDECESNPCMNDSQCIDGINEFACVCQTGLTGRLCDINIDDCLSQPCQNGALCIDGLNSYTCNCDNTGYMGEHCEINIDDCLSNPCTNGGICHDQVKDYYCKCYNGYSGKNCEIDIDECEKQPCKDGGTCLERSNKTLYQLMDPTLPDDFRRPFDYSLAAGYDCLCVPGITGPNCEYNINECESNPCFHGTCLDKTGYYLCQCDDGFEGVHCESNIDECEQIHPCIHGKCRDGIANYFCDCEQGYGGKNCSVELAGCKQNPCRNNGTCIPFVQNESEHRYNCTCQSGFYGPSCEILTTMSLTANSVIEVNTTKEEGYEFQFRFKTTLEDGLLALGKGQTYIILELSEGKLTLNSSLLNKLDGVSVGRNLNNSEWQRVFVAINSSHVVLSANDEQTIYPITLNEYNTSATSFPTTYIGGVPGNLRNLAHGPPHFVGCIEDVRVNSKWVLPTVKSPYASFWDVEAGCHREPQCSPNPCHSGGHCTDKWQDFSCTCKRPYLGHTCQYNFTAATFGHENITNSLVTVTVDKDAKRAVRSIVDISMFIRTRQSKGQIFYLGSIIGSAKDQGETYIAAQLEGGELRVKIQFHGNSEAYTVGGVHLDNGYNHLIEVIRNVTLVQVKLNGTEYFRKTISATGTLDAEVLFLGGLPGPRPVRQILNSTEPDAITAPFSRFNFKGIIQDVQVSNGSKTMVVEFFPLSVDDLKIPMSFGTVEFDTRAVLSGVLSDDLCSPNPCYNGTCMNTWNDYQCKCPRGYKGKDCKEKEFCEIEHCPPKSECRNLEDGFECIANATFDGETTPIVYNFTSLTMTTVAVESFELSYRTKSWGTVFYAKYRDSHFVIFVHFDEVIVEWNIAGRGKATKFAKDHFDGQWITLYMRIKDGTLKGGFKELVNDDTPNFIENDLDVVNFSDMFLKGFIYIGGNDDSAYSGTDYMMVTDTTTDGSLVYNTLDAYSNYSVPHEYFNKRFKGCLGEIRIDNFLLPYFRKSELPYFAKPELYPKSSAEYFELLPGAAHHIGCRLCYKKDCNRGECIDPVNSYKCNCPVGFTSDDCSVDINECEQNECKNDAQCIDLIGMYSCNCTLGYDGILCDHEINECESNPCQNGGTCMDLIGMFNCTCPEEFVGEQCEHVRLITCMNSPCKRGATCRDDEDKKTGNNFTCDCTQGMAGTLCDTPYCVLDKCMNNGRCNINVNPPKCDCAPGFEGNLCTINIDDCESSPCKNGGICIDRVNGYDCECVAGFNGTNCEFDIDECAALINPCGRGKCNNTLGGYKCVCDNQKCGYNCNMDDPCLRGPCENSGMCEAACTSEPDYKCECFVGWRGKNCTEPELASAESQDGINILYIVIPVVVFIVVGLAIAFVVLVNIARSKRATRGTYSPSAQEFCNPRVELDHVLKPPPEERLI